MDRPRATLASVLLLLSTTLLMASDEPPYPARGYAAQPPAGSSMPTRVSVSASGKGTPWINLRDARALDTSFSATERASAVDESAKPLSLLAVDLDEDGVPDLICGYETPTGGVLLVFRGNIDSIYPKTPEAEKRRSEGTFIDSPFFPSPTRLDLPLAPQFLEAGDFDADGHVDLVASDGKGNILYRLQGDGRRGFARPDPIHLPGPVTALVGAK